MHRALQNTARRPSRPTCSAGVVAAPGTVAVAIGDKDGLRGCGSAPVQAHSRQSLWQVPQCGNAAPVHHETGITGYPWASALWPKLCPVQAHSWQSLRQIPQGGDAAPVHRKARLTACCQALFRNLRGIWQRSMCILDRLTPGRASGKHLRVAMQDLCSMRQASQPVLGPLLHGPKHAPQPRCSPAEPLASTSGLQCSTCAA